MKKLTIGLAILVSTIGLTLPSFLVAEEFNANYIISDDEMQDWQGMDRSDIQAFLKDNGGYISNLHTDDLNGTRRTAADIIYRAAQEHEINPKYLLVKLQKEQSLITDPSPSQKQLDGATGYGITDGCGWSCDTYFRNKGFGKQVDSAAGIMRWYYDNVNQEGWIKKANTAYTIDNTRVVPANYATAFLYTYTPHIQGNQNFWKLWQRWFEQVYPDGSLVRTDENPEIFLIQGGTKRHITSMAALVTRFNPKLIITIPQSELTRYETSSPVSFPNYSILKSGSKYYLLDYDMLRPFESHDVVRALGYHPDEIIEITAGDVKNFEIGKTITSENAYPLGRLIRLVENNQLYFLKDGVYQPIFDEVIAKINYPTLVEEEVTVEDLRDYTPGDGVTLKDGILFGIKGSNKIYVSEAGEKRHIASSEIFTGMGYDWDNIIWVDQFGGMSHENGQAIYLRQTMQTASTDNDASDVGDEEEGNGIMIRTPADETQFIGPVFDTDVDVYLVADYESKEILAGKNIDFVRPLASFTKVVAAYQLMKEGINMSNSVEYSGGKHRSLYHHFRIAEGEKIRNSNLMDAFLVSSLNTPAHMLIDGARANFDEFVTEMNAKAADWSLTKTSFVDPAGTRLGNVGTAREYLTLYKNATKNATIKEYLAKKEYEYDEVLDLDDKPHHYDNHSNDLVNKANLGFNIITSKTGYLDEAGAGLAMQVMRPSDRKQFIIITMGNADYSHRFDEPEALTKWALSKF